MVGVFLDRIKFGVFSDFVKIWCEISEVDIVTLQEIMPGIYTGKQNIPSKQLPGDSFPFSGRERTGF